jgi:hypothetical protein
MGRASSAAEGVVRAARALLTNEPMAMNSTSARQIFQAASKATCPWRHYLSERRFVTPKFATAAPEQQRAALTALSAALTFPLTIAHAWTSKSSTLRLCVVGARAEAVLPAHAWSELSLLTGARRIELECGGPAVPAAAGPPRRWASTDGEQQLQVSLAAADLFHRTGLGRVLLERRKRSRQQTRGGGAGRGTVEGLGATKEESLELPDAFVLFNPGLGEPGWERAWGPTMRALEEAGRPVMMTALSEEDAERDARFIAADGRAPSLAAAAADAPYMRNPFASLLQHGEATAGGAGGLCTLSNSVVRVLRPS